MLDRDELVTLAKRLLAHVDAGTTDQAEDTFAVPAASYADPGLWAREMDVIFKRKPLVLALTCELREPGAFKATDVLGVPVLLTRGADGAVRAFLNVCRHRGAALADEGCGTARRFACPYHGWVYDSSGELVGVYGEESFGLVDRSERGLVALPCEERHGFVFVVLTPGTPMNLDEWLGDYGAELAKLDLSSWHLFTTNHVDGAGWKVCYDGYLEGYHFASLHRDTIFKSTMSNVMAVDAWGPHQRVVFPHHGITELHDQAEPAWAPTQHLDPVYTIFPHVSIAGCWDDQAMVSQLIPGPTYDRSHTTQWIISRQPADTPDQEKRLSRFAAFLERVVRTEDYKTGLDIQKGIASGANDTFLFGRNEMTLHRYHRWVAQLLAEVQP